MPSLKRYKNSMIERTLTYDELGLSTDEILTSIPSDAAMRQEVLSLIDEIQGFLHAKFAFVTTDIQPIFRFHPGKIITNQLKGSEALCWFVATAGQEFEAFQHRLTQEDDMVRVYLANEIGSIIAEKTADQMEDLLQEQLTPKGLYRTNRYSPGYCGWKVSEQPILFELFRPKVSAQNSNVPPTPCDIHLTDSCLMIPIKSVSGVIGIGHNVRRRDYTCNLCGLSTSCKRGRKQ
jgi:hypothetical protein